MQTIGIVASTVLCVSILILASIKDVKTKRIPIWMFPTMGILGFAIRMITGYSKPYLYSALFGASAMGLIMFLIAIIGGAGGADILMMAAIGLVAGDRYAFEILIIAYVPFVLYSIYLVIKEKRQDKSNRTKELPLAPFVTFGFVADTIYNIIFETLH